LNLQHNYSTLDRLVHRLAFSSHAVQFTAADIGTRLYGSRYRHIRVVMPIFVTSLPRAGTTVVLEILSRVPSVATHRYRDMPFVMAPLLWDAISRGFRKPAELKERAHGDGMTVGYDSAEAFEEVLWRAFWPEKFQADRICLWSEDEDRAEFSEFFREHIQQIIASRSDASVERQRYVSKNNANVARIRFLRGLFPDGQLVVPFRDPIDQAVSLLEQHRRSQVPDGSRTRGLLEALHGGYRSL
jgi:hypothetical protein